MTIRPRTTAHRSRFGRGDLTARAWVALESRVRTLRGDDRGDVPGWVLVTLMTAGLVAVLWGLAQTQLGDIFEDAINSVSPKN